MHYDTLDGGWIVAEFCGGRWYLFVKTPGEPINWSVGTLTGQAPRRED